MHRAVKAGQMLGRPSASLETKALLGPHIFLSLLKAVLAQVMQRLTSSSVVTVLNIVLPSFLLQRAQCTECLVLACTSPRGLW